MADLDSRLRASIAAQMLMPREEKPDPEALKRLENHLLQLRQRIEDDAHAAHDEER